MTVVQVGGCQDQPHPSMSGCCVYVYMLYERVWVGGSH